MRRSVNKAHQDYKHKSRIKIGTGFVLVFSLFYFLDESGIFAAVLISAAAHELGHMFAILLMGTGVTGIRLELTGAAITYDNRRVSYWGEAFIAAMGPVFGVAFSILTASLSRFGDRFYIISGVSFCLSALNLLPAVSLDGGMILYSALSGIKNELIAEKVLCVTTCLSCLALMALGCYVLFVTRSNFTFLLVGAWILLDYIRTSVYKAAPGA